MMAAIVASIIPAVTEFGTVAAERLSNGSTATERIATGPAAHRARLHASAAPAHIPIITRASPYNHKRRLGCRMTSCGMTGGGVTDGAAGDLKDLSRRKRFKSARASAALP